MLKDTHVEHAGIFYPLVSLEDTAFVDDSIGIESLNGYYVCPLSEYAMIWDKLHMLRNNIDDKRLAAYDMPWDKKVAQLCLIDSKYHYLRNDKYLSDDKSSSSDS